MSSLCPNDIDMLLVTDLYVGVREVGHLTPLLVRDQSYVSVAHLDTRSFRAGDVVEVSVERQVQ